jgi:hypothetical protein
MSPFEFVCAFYWNCVARKAGASRRFFLVGLVASIYLVTVLLFPRVPESGGQIDLDAHYIRTGASFFW